LNIVETNKSLTNKLDNLTNTVRNNNLSSDRTSTELINPDNKILNRSIDDMRAIDDQICELQEYNAKVESELNRLKSEYFQLEQQIDSSEKVIYLLNFHKI